MSKLKKLGSMLLALVFAIGMTCTALAADATITVENSVTGKSYAAYKIFDATSSGSAVSYTIDTDDAWYTLVYNSGLFTLNQAGSTNTYYVTQTGTNEQVIAFINANYDSVNQEAAATGTGNGGSLTLTVGEAGYYYVTTTSGTVITVDTAADSVTVIDKNQTPGGDLDKSVDDTKAQIGDTLTYTITASVPAYDGTTKIENYTFTDVLDAGLIAPSADDVTVQILDSTGAVVATLTNVVDVSGQTITVSYNPTTITDYPADATIKITYTATVDVDAVYANNNKVTMVWTGNSTGKTDEETVYTYGFELKKVDGADTSTQLEGAQFHLTDGTNTIYFVYTESTNTYTVVPADTEGAITVITVGSATIFGLDADETYYLYEDKAPEGYNLITGVAATITVGQTDAEGNVLYSTTSGINTSTTQVENNAGTSLPGTGGMGTTIFYIVGGVLAAGAVVLLITKKRMAE